MVNKVTLATICMFVCNSKYIFNFCLSKFDNIILPNLFKLYFARILYHISNQKHPRHLPHDN